MNEDGGDQVVQTGNLSSHIDMHTHLGSMLRDPVALTFDLLTSGLMQRTCDTMIVCINYQVWC